MADDDDDIDAEQLVLGDLLNHVLDKGVVISGTVTISIANIDLLLVDLAPAAHVGRDIASSRYRSDYESTGCDRGDGMSTHLYCVLPDEAPTSVPSGLTGVEGGSVRALPVDRPRRLGERRRARRSGVDRRGARARCRRRSGARDGIDAGAGALRPAIRERRRVRRGARSAADRRSSRCWRRCRGWSR